MADRRAGRSSSLSFRLALVAAAGSAAALLLAGIVFITLFRQAMERNFDERLEALLNSLVGAAVEEAGIRPSATENIGEPRFNLPQSGWYWQIRDGKGEVVAASNSLFGDRLGAAGLPEQGEGMRKWNFAGPNGSDLRGLEQVVSLESGQRYAVLVAGDADALSREVRRFQTVVVLTLGAFAGLLAGGMGLLIRFGLRPLRDVRRALTRVRHGREAKLSGAYPTEIAPLVDDLNALIASNREIVERARTHVGNLAHALKTPIAVIQNESRELQAPSGTKIAEQIAVMRDQVDRHLNRARMAAQANVIGAITPVAEAVEGIARVMRKVHQDRDLEITTDVAPDLRFRGERQDFEEMVGNLFDNACKWAGSKVHLTADAVTEGRLALLVIRVEDDGPGLADEAKDRALSRGARLDESKPGSGLGLAIVLELTRVYGGALSLEDSELGGLRAVLNLPSASGRDF